MSKLDRLGWVAQKTYVIEGIPVGIRTTSHAFGAWLDYALRAYGSDEKSDPVYSIVVGEQQEGKQDRKPGLRATFHILYQWSTQIVRTRHLSTLAEALLTELCSFGFVERTDAIYLRAGLVAGESGLALVPAGFVPHIGRLGGQVRKVGIRLGTALWTALDIESGQILPIRRQAPIPGDALDRLGTFVTSPGGKKDLLSIEAPSIVDVIYTSSPSRSEGARAVQSTSRAQALAHLSATAVNLSSLGGSCLHGLAGLLRQARCYDLKMASPRKMLQALSSVLGGREVA